MESSQKARQTIIFTRGVPPAEALPVDLIADCAQSIIKSDPTLLLYGNAPGYPPLRALLAESQNVPVESVLISNGSLQIMGFLARELITPGDTVLVESPSYDRALTIFKGAGARLVGVPLEDDGVNIEALEEILRTNKPKFFYVIGDFQNPTGATWSAKKRERVAELAKAQGFLIIEDAPYRMLRYSGEYQPTFLSLAPDSTLQLSSFSKLLSPGLRAGYVIGPKEIIARLARIAEDTYITGVLPAQGIVYEFIRRGLLEPNIEKLRDLYRPRLQATLDALAQEMPDATWTRPDGGFFVGVTLPKGIKKARLMEEAKAVDLVLTDGDGFFIDPPERTFVRLPFCALKPETIREGVARLAGAANAARDEK